MSIFLKFVDMSTNFKSVDLSICQSVDYSRQIIKSTDRQIDRSTINKFDLGHKNHEKTEFLCQPNLSTYLQKKLTDQQTNFVFWDTLLYLPFFQDVIFSSFKLTAGRLYVFFPVVIFSGCNLNPLKNIAGQTTVRFYFRPLRSRQILLLHNYNLKKKGTFFSGRNFFQFPTDNRMTVRFFFRS